MLNIQNNMANTLGGMNARANFISYMEMMGNHVDPNDAAVPTFGTAVRSLAKQHGVIDQPPKTGALAITEQQDQWLEHPQAGPPPY